MHKGALEHGVGTCLRGSDAEAISLRGFASQLQNSPNKVADAAAVLFVRRQSRLRSS